MFVQTMRGPLFGTVPLRTFCFCALIVAALLFAGAALAALGVGHHQKISATAGGFDHAAGGA